MYPRNAASPPRLSVGAVIQISDGAVQTSGVSIVVRPEGGSETAGGGTLSYGATSGIVYYTPTQAETDYTAFVVVAYKTGCIPAEKSVVTSASATAGHAGTDQGKIANPTSTVNLSGTTIKNATDNASQTSVNDRPTLAQIEASTVLAKEATVGTRASQTSVNAIPTNPLLTNDSRLNNLDFSIAAVNTAIGNLNNLSALINLYGSPLMEIPDTGSTVYAFTIVVRDNEGKLVNLDASPTLAASNAAGTSRSANLSAVSNPSTGRYTFTYSVANTHAKESLRITASGTVSAEARYIEWVGAVVDYDTLTTLQAVQTTVNGIDSRLPASPAAVSDIPTANQNRDAVWNALMANYTIANTFGHHVIRSVNSNNTVQITGGGSYHIFSVIHDSEPNSIHEDAFDDNALSARVLASSAASEVATAVGNLQVLTRLDSMIESDGAGQFRFDSVAVSLAGGGGGGGTDWTTDEKTAIRAILGFNSSGTIISLSSGALFNITTQTANLFKYGDAQRWNSPANQIDVTITKVP